MKLAYDRNMRKIWVLNVGDIKPSEYLTEFFLDMAWDINLSGCKSGSGVVFSHLGNWLNQTFGKKTGKELLPLMKDFYLLSHIRKPEFMGNTRTYDKRHEQIADLPWSTEEINERLEQFKNYQTGWKKLYATVPSNRKDAYFEMIQYPVQASNEMNKRCSMHSLPATPRPTALLYGRSPTRHTTASFPLTRGSTPCSTANGTTSSALPSRTDRDSTRSSALHHPRPSVLPCPATVVERHGT